jgi:hypothetical protein
MKIILDFSFFIIYNPVAAFAADAEGLVDKLLINKIFAVTVFLTH